MSTEAQDLHRVISTSVIDMLDAYRIQASAGPVTDKALEEIISGPRMASSRASRRIPLSSGSRCCRA